MKNLFTAFHRGSAHFWCAPCWLAALLLLIQPGSLRAQFRYTTNNGAITITQFTGSGDFVIIPATTNGFPVVAIAKNAFYGLNLTNVSIPESITNIGNAAFANSSSLTSITVDPSNPAYSALSGVLFDKAQTTLVEFPPALSQFGNYDIPTNVMVIGDYAFYGSQLSSVSIPTNVVSLGNYAFESCRILTSVAIPYSVTSIGSNAFTAGISLTSISVDPSNPAFSSTNGVLFDKAQLTLIQAPAGIQGSYIIPGSVTRIGQSSFYQCDNLTDVAIPNGVTSIDDYAFYQCSALTGLVFPNSVTSIGSYSFGSCSFSSMTLSSNLTSIGVNAFNSCGLRSVTFPKSLASLGSEAFSSCSVLTNALFEGNAPPDNGGAFSGDPNATVYYLPGTTGWGTRYGGAPTALWVQQTEPQVQAATITGGEFGFGLSGPAGSVVIVQACTNLSAPVWVPVGTNTLTGGASSFKDAQWNSFPQRFYRFKLP